LEGLDSGSKPASTAPQMGRSLISAVVVPEDRLNLVRATGLVIAFCGVAWVFTAHTESPLAPNPALGNALVLTAATLLAIRMVYTRPLAPNALDCFDPIGTTEPYSTVIGI